MGNARCVQCGRLLPRQYKHGLCDKHYSQLKTYGEFLDDNPRDCNDPNEIEIEGELAKIELYDLLFEPLDDKILIDAEDIDKVKDYGIDFPKKKLLCKVVLEDCIEIDEEFNKMVKSLDPNVYSHKSRDGYAWKLGKITKINIDKEINGQLGLWNYDVDK
jgi:hypothetical protein